MIRDGSQVKFHFTLHVDGRIVEATDRAEPFEYVQGSGRLIPGLEQALAGMQEGEKKSITIAPDQAFGTHSPEAIHRVTREQFTNAESLSVGDPVQGRMEGRPFRATVTAMDDEAVTLDFNHPFAGKTLEFDIEIVEVA